MSRIGDIGNDPDMHPLPERDEPNLHDDLTDSIVRAFFRDNEDVKLEIVIDWVEDLGIRVLVTSAHDESFARSGSADSVTDAINKVIAKATPKLIEHREDQARIKAAYEAAISDDEDD